MKTLCWLTIILLACSLLAGAQASASGKATARPAVSPQRSPTPAPTPAAPQVPIRQAPAVTGPKYSPALMDFGIIDYKASSRKTFSLTAPTSGEITLQLSRSAFAAVELRRVPPPAQGNMQPLRTPPTTPVPASGGGFYLIYKWNFVAGEEMQLDILFNPQTLQDSTPGTRNASLDLSGPGTQPWHLNIPLRGVVAGLQGQANPETAPSAQTKKPALTSPSSSAQATANALPTPNPGPKGAILAPNTPTHSPDNFDFGEVWDGDMLRKTFHLTTTAAGYVTVQIPKGPFRVAEFREMGAVQLPSKNNPANKSTQNLGPIQPVKNRVTYQDGQYGPFQWSLAPDTDIQIDIAFQPHFQFGSEMAGQKSATVKVTGPGRHGNWTLSVPLVGMFDGLKLSATIFPQPKELYAFAGDKVSPFNITLYGLDHDITGSVRLGDNPPPGVSLNPKTLKVGAKQQTSATDWLSLGSFPADGTARALELVFDDGSKKSKAQIQFIGLPNSRTFSSGNRSDCGIGDLSLTVAIRAPQHNTVDKGSYITDLDRYTGIPGSLTYTLQGSLNFVIKKYLMLSLWLKVEADGTEIFKQGFDFREHADHVTETRNMRLDLPGETWKRILNGQARVGCQLSAYWTSEYSTHEDGPANPLCINSGGCTEWKWAPVR